MALRPQSPDAEKGKAIDRQAAQQDVFLREVDEALRQDQMASFFKRYGIPVLTVVVIGLLGLAGYLWWDHSHKAAEGERGEKLIVALDSIEAGNLEAAEKQLKPLADESKTGNAVAAKLLTAGIALEQKRPQDAIRLYQQISADAKAPQPYRDLATVREMSAAFDTLKPQQVIDRLKPLAVPGNPWFGPAGELVAMAYLKQGKKDLAGPLFAQIARDKDTPDSLRRRSRQMAGLLGVDAIDDAEKIAQGENAGAGEPAPQ